MTSIIKKNLEADYKLLLSWRYGSIEFLGLPNFRDNRPLPLEDIYVPLSFTLERRGEERFYLPKMLDESRHLVVLGDPGSGKSTLVKLITHAFGRLETNSLRQRFGPLLPIPVILRDYRVRDWKDYRDMLAAFIEKLDEEVRSEVTVEWLLGYLERGEAFLMLDGIDEVGSKGNREYLRDRIFLPLLEDAPESYFLLTSRIIGYDEVSFGALTGQHATGAVKFIKVSSLNTCHVAPFSTEDIEQFVTRWYRLRESDANKQREGIESFKLALRQNERVRGLAENPSLLTLMALIHRVTAHLPSGRVKLYDKIVEAYLETIDLHRKLKDRPAASLEEMKLWLARVGWEMQSRRTAEEQGDLLVHRDEVLRWLREAGAGEEAAAFLDWVARRSGLLLPRGAAKDGADLYAFVHLTFQEYFAAFWLRNKVWDFGQLAEECAAKARQPHWHETLCVLFEMLAEFTGPGDKLLDRLAAKATEEERAVTARLFAALLPDTQNGLSATGQRQAAVFVLDELCRKAEPETAAALKALPQFDEWIARPLRERLLNSPPGELGEDFFLTGDELLPEEWPQLVAAMMEQRAGMEWTPDQLQDIALCASGRLDFVRLAAQRLPLDIWCSYWTDGWYWDDVSLAEINLETLVKLGSLAPDELLLTESALTLAASGNQIFRVALGAELSRSLSLSRSRSRSLSLSLSRSRSLSLSRSWSLSRSRSRSRSRSLSLSLSRSRSRSLSLSLSRSRSRSLSLSLLIEALAEPRLEAARSGDALVEAGLDAEWLAWQPAREDECERAVERNRELLRGAGDDWTRLNALSNLLALGAGTPELCEQRNELLDRAMQRPASFTFPANVQKAAERADFNLPEVVKIIFWHEPGDPFLRPEWFAPGSEEARFLCATPRQLYALAAEILDPEGETALAQWRDDAKKGRKGEREKG